MYVGNCFGSVKPNNAIINTLSHTREEITPTIILKPKVKLCSLVDVFSDSTYQLFWQLFLI